MQMTIQIMQRNELKRVHSNEVDMNLTFTPAINNVGQFPTEFDDNDIKNETMFFNCDLRWAYENGGKITKRFIESLPLDWVLSAPVIDTRVHMLMPGWYPCIPGWHHDDVPRTTKSGQPNYTNPEYHSEHLVGLVNASVCPTEFLLDKISLDLPEEGKIIYEEWDREIRSKKRSTMLMHSGELVQFDCNTFHRGTKARKTGWRWFARLSRSTDRQKNITNEIRRNAQVYLEYPNKGW